eukprot:CAMPEP_0174830342 /NCGR_PEP_ID=MMETSP1114-20130205/2466_1 /TAXON_ID=312471 /ORGANISM="Neobodo designis, Strain CCAP 1951/1" /LENGTH=273 /DNA_ID=CAMNT_0016064137 /DNA_START=134 /DNA_END=955 /DNA_ORIENTATION=-
MLSVVFAGGAKTRVPHNPDATVAALLDSVRHEKGACDPAPGRERAYLAAAVASAATVRPLAATAPAPTREASPSDGSDPNSASGLPVAGADGGGPVADLVGFAFRHDPPFPPVRLRPEATLRDAGIAAEGTVHVTFIAPQVVVDPTRRNFSRHSATPTRSTPCAELAGRYGGVGRDVIVHCNNACGRGGEVYGGDGNCYSRDSALCKAAVHAGALAADKAGYFTVRLAGFRDRFAATTRNGVAAIAYNARFMSITIHAYLPGDEETLGGGVAS